MNWVSVTCNQDVFLQRSWRVAARSRQLKDQEGSQRGKEKVREADRALWVQSERETSAQPPKPPALFSS